MSHAIIRGAIISMAIVAASSAIACRAQGGVIETQSQEGSSSGPLTSAVTIKIPPQLDEANCPLNAPAMLPRVVERFNAILRRDEVEALQIQIDRLKNFRCRDAVLNRFFLNLLAGPKFGIRRR